MMLKEQITINYACDIIRITSNNTDLIQAATIAQQIGASKSYCFKVLARMTTIGLLRSSFGGYELAKPISQYTIGDVLKICHGDAKLNYSGKIDKLLIDHADQVLLSTIL